ncbi:MAG: hypothetical protein ACOYD4_04170 [Solirubrobacterales bacterium]
MNNPPDLYADTMRSAIAHHRNQIRFLCQMIRDGAGHPATCLSLAKSHAQDIKELFNQWEAHRNDRSQN